MALNNLRIITTNLVTNGTLSTPNAVITGMTIQNLKNDKKSSVWRVIGTTATFTLTTSSSKIGGIILPFCNLTTTAKVDVHINETIDPTPYIDERLVCPWDRVTPTNWGSIPTNLNTYAYGGGTYAVCWFPTQQTGITTITVVITDTANTAGYLEFSNLIIGEYWSPTHNTSYGLNTGITDSSVIDRSESGNLISCRKPSHRTMQFNLDWLNTADRIQMQKIVQGAGKSASIFISLFPEEGSNLENYHQIYGKQTQLSNIAYNNYFYYSSSIDIEEI